MPDKQSTAVVRYRKGKELGKVVFKQRMQGVDNPYKKESDGVAAAAKRAHVRKVVHDSAKKL